MSRIRWILRWVLRLVLPFVAYSCIARPAPAQPLDESSISVADVLRRVRSDPPRVIEALAALHRRQAEEGYARSAYLPSITAQLSGGAAYDNRLVLPNTPRIDSQFLTAQGTLTMDWSALNLAREANIEAAHAGVRAERDAFETTVQKALQTALELYFDALARTRLVQDATITLQRRSEQHRAIRGLVLSGLRPPVDAQRAEIELLSSRYDLDLRRNDERAAFAALSAAVGGDPARPLRPEPAPQGLLDLSLSPSDAERLAARFRPEAARARHALEARRADQSAAADARLPTVGILLNGAMSYLDVLKGVGIDGYTYNGSALAYVRWNGLEPAVWGRADVARAAALEAASQQKSALALIRADVVAAVYALRRAETGLARAVALQHSAEATRRSQNGRYSSGLASMLELLDAENLEQSARRAVIEAGRDEDVARIRLLAACGLIDRIAV